MTAWANSGEKNAIQSEDLHSKQTNTNPRLFEIRPESPGNQWHLGGGPAVLQLVFVASFVSNITLVVVCKIENQQDRGGGGSVGQDSRGNVLN